MNDVLCKDYTTWSLNLALTLTSGTGTNLKFEGDTRFLNCFSSISTRCRIGEGFLCFHDNHCDTQLWAPAADLLLCLGRLSLPPSEGRRMRYQPYG